MYSKRLIYNQLMSFVQGKCWILLFSVQQFFSVDPRHKSQFIGLQCGSVDWFLLVFTVSNFGTERFYSSGHMVSIGHRWEVQMTSYAPLLSSEGLKLRSRLKMNLTFRINKASFSFFF